ncbi:hypothetical protein BJ322DRAFT_1021515 [Thelephora terrestris]|uniref:Zn(2)-C6 fungal-type domain-containing protein n=1 Tax=Thelephora terrestris TaxID=56493 RepID=A0A9P6L605_9AGAM|nr:hypothetical protein BJ322DRAFT_1021515 [Thelephora terrestris]
MDPHPLPRGKACLPCRYRRTKCDGVKPTCSRCKEKGSLCQYSEEKSGQEPQQEVVSLESQVREAELRRLNVDHSAVIYLDENILSLFSESPIVFGFGTFLPKQSHFPNPFRSNHILNSASIYSKECGFLKVEARLEYENWIGLIYFPCSTRSQPSDSISVVSDNGIAVNSPLGLVTWQFIRLLHRPAMFQVLEAEVENGVFIQTCCRSNPATPRDCEPDPGQRRQREGLVMNCKMDLRISTSMLVEKEWDELEDGFRKLEQIPPIASRGQTCHRGQSASPDVAGKQEEERNAAPLRQWGGWRSILPVQINEPWKSFVHDGFSDGVVVKGVNTIYSEVHLVNRKITKRYSTDKSLAHPSGTALAWNRATLNPCANFKKRSCEPRYETLGLRTNLLTPPRPGKAKLNIVANWQPVNTAGEWDGAWHSAS